MKISQALLIAAVLMVSIAFEGKAAQAAVYPIAVAPMTKPAVCQYAYVNISVKKGFDIDYTSLTPNLGTLNQHRAICMIRENQNPQAVNFDTWQSMPYCG